MTAIPATAPKKKTRQSNKMAFLLSLVLGGFAAVMAFVFLSSQKTDSAPPAPPTVLVVVAAQDIAARTVITADMLTTKDIFQSDAHPDIITDLQSVVGAVARDPILAGEPVLKARLADANVGLGLTTLIPEGQRAVSIEVTEVIGSNGLINPGDKVDVVAAFDKQKADVDMAITVLQDVTVLAVARELTPVEPTPTSGDGVQNADQQAQARTVTLAVTPQQAQDLFLAEYKGSLRLSLRPLNDENQAQIPGIRLSELQGR